MRRVSRAPRLRASIRVPGDKSVSHRALMLNAIAEGEAAIERILDSADVRSTAACLAQLGVTIDWPPGSTTARVSGAGLHGLREADAPLDCGNSGTTMRLMTGLLGGQAFLSILTGDASLRSRPMARVIEPIRAMGGHLHGRAGDTLAPIVISGSRLHGIDFASPVASAQVKSAVLLAALYADDPSSVTEPAASRDHTERMLAAMGADLLGRDGRVRLNPGRDLTATSLRVPGDISSAAPWLVLAACHNDAELVIENVGVNPTRTGLLDILATMGAEVEVGEPRTSGGEPVADIVVRSSGMHGTRVEGNLIPRAIDELPLVAILGCFADGDTIVAGAEELRVKESDRVEMVARILQPMGARIEARPDGFVVHGPCPLAGASADAGGDHRMGMLAAIAGSLAEGETVIERDAVEVSYPAFWDDLKRAATQSTVPA